jgi:hypothetical protein
MKRVTWTLLVLLCGLAVCEQGQAQESGGVTKNCPEATPCFPRNGCRDDYRPNPWPRQCWLPYPPYYQCVPAGDGRKKDKLTWWFLPTPRALHEAVWWRP